MSVGFIENVDKSFGYAVDNTLKKIRRWIGLTIVMCIPIVNFIAMGLFLKVFRGEEPDFSNAGKSFIQGLLLFIISIIYMIIPIIAFVILVGASIITAIIAPVASAILAGGGIIALFVLAIIFGLIMLPAEINFARKQSFGAAFEFGEIFGMIGKLGWGKYILSIILIYIISLIFGFVVGLVGVGLVAANPVLGAIISFLAIPFANPFAKFFEFKYYANLFE